MESPIHILVVDDHPDVVRATRRVLDQAGYTTTAAFGGAEALQCLRDGPVDLILLDREMPGLDGMEVCRQIKQNSACAGVFVILISGTYTQSEEQVAGLESGADGYLVRPIANRELVARVGAFVRILRLTRALQASNAELHASELEFRSLAEAMPQIVWACRPDGANIYFNQQWVDYTGMTLEESYGAGWNKPFHPDDQQRAWVAWQNATQNHGTYSLECRLRRADGVYRWWLIRGVPHRDADGKVQKWFGTCTDIEDIKRTEAALRESKDHLENLIGHANAPIIVWNADGQITRFNRAFEEIAGRPAEQVLGKGLEFLFADDERERAMALVRRASAGERFELVEVPIQHTSGSQRTVLWNSAPIFGADGQTQVATIAQGHDITKRKQAELALRREQEFERVLLDHIADGVVACDAQGKLVLFNRAARAWHGLDALALPPEEWSSHYHLFGPDGTTPLSTEAVPLVRAFRGETVRDAGMTIVARDQPPRHILASGSPFFDAEHNLLGAVVAMRDLTERRQAEVALRESEAMFKGFFEHSNVGKSITQLSGEVQVNQALCDLLGYSPAELQHRSWQSLSHSEDVASTQRVVDALLAGTQNSARFTKRFLHKNGSVVWADLSTTLRRDAAGQPLYFMTAVIDITARQQAEAKLVMIRKAVEATSDAVGISDAQGRHIFQNQALTNLFGYATAEELQAAGGGPAVVKDPAVAREMYATILRGESWEGDLEMVTKSGRVFPAYERADAIKDEAGQIIGLIGVITDITGRKQAEATLRRDEARFRSLTRILQHPAQTTQEFLDFALEEALKLTASKLGYIYFYHEDRRQFVLNTWSKDVMQECTVVNPQTCYELDKTGIWGEAVRQRQPILLNDFQAAHPLKKGYPEGHAALHNYLTLPIFNGDQIVAVVAVANKATDYDQTDVEQLRMLLDAVWKVVERRNAREAQAASEERFRRAVLESPFPILLHAEDGAILQASNSWCEITGYTHAELATIGDWTERAYGERKQLVQADIDALYGLDHRKYEGDYTIRTKSGGTRIWEFSSAPLERLPDGRRLVISMATDVTERRQAEQAVLASEMRYRRLFESAKDGILILDAETGRVVDVNPFLIEMLGYSRAVFLGKKVWELGFFKDIVANQDSFAELQAKEYIRYEDKPLETGDGRRIEVEFISNLYQVNQQKVIQCNIRDISGRKRAELQIFRLNQTLEQRVLERTAQLAAANQELEAFSYSVSHDLRAPLRAIHGFARILVDEQAARLDAEGRRQLGIVCQEAERMGQLIDDLLAFARMNRQDMQLAPVDLTALAQAVFAECQAQASDRQINFHLTPLPPARGDRALLRQVLVNLLANAVKYTRPRAVAEITLGGRTEGQEHVYFVKDNGVGFDMRYATKLFGVFQRLHANTEFEGTGVGLALVQRVIQRHGGRVWAEATVNEGATFYFTLPAQKDRT